MRKNEKAIISAEIMTSIICSKTNEKTSKTNFKGEIDSNYNNTKQPEFQYKTSGLSKLSQTTTNFVCVECNLPLSLYGENHIKSCTGGQSNILRTLCDSHAAEFGFAAEVK